MPVKISILISLFILWFGAVCSQDTATRPLCSAELPGENEPVCILRVEPAAVFPGGTAAMKQFICKHFVHPPDSLLPDSGVVAGTVLVQFTVEKNGRITDPVIVRGMGYGYDQAVLDLIRKMPRWKPAKEFGIAVKSCHRLPVVFEPGMEDEPICNPGSASSSLRQ